MPMRTHQLLLGIAALCMAHASIAQEKIAVLVPAVLDPSAPIEDSVKRECNVEGMIGNEVFQRVSERYPGTAQFQNPGQAGDGYVLKVTITSVVGAGGGAWTGKRRSAFAPTCCRTRISPQPRTLTARLEAVYTAAR